MVDITARIDINHYDTDQYTNWDELWICLDLLQQLKKHTMNEYPHNHQGGSYENPLVRHERL